jgi:TolA-binding protein
LKQFTPAIEDLRSFLRSQPDAAERPDALYVLGLCQSGSGKPADAVATYQQLLEEYPDYSGADKAYYELAWTHKDLNEEDEALTAFEKLARNFERSPLAAESHYHVGEHYYARDEYQRAADAYDAALQKAGKSELAEKAAHKLGWARYRQKDFAAAREAFAEQRAAFPQGTLVADAAFMEAESLFEQKKYPEALAAYEKLDNLSNENFSVLALLHAGQAAAQLKQWDKSLKLLDRCLKQHPEAELTPEVRYEQAWALENLGRIDEALAAYEAVTAKNNREVAARARFMIGELHFQRKDHAEAIRNFYKVAYGYGYPEWQANALYEAARCFEVLKKTDQARKDYQEIITKFPQSDKAPLAQKRIAELGG